MGFIQAIATCFRKYAVFSGRAPRSEFWYFVLFIVLAQFALGIAVGVSVVATGSMTFSWISDLFTLATLLPGIAVTNRRLHDTGRSGWWQAPFLFTYGLSIAIGIYILATMGFSGMDGLTDLIANVMENLSGYAVLGIIFSVIWLVAIVFGIIVFVFCFFKSHGDNQYGPAPLASAADGDAASAADSSATSSTHADGGLSDSGMGGSTTSDTPSSSDGGSSKPSDTDAPSSTGDANSGGMDSSSNDTTRH